MLEKVFAHLTVEELLKCRLVNKLWNSIALLRNHLGAKTVITLNQSNIDRLNQTSEKMLLPFCQQFVLTFMNLDEANSSILPFKKVFKNCISFLSLDCCTASRSKVVTRLLKAPNLKELKITGALLKFSPETTMPFRRLHLTRLLKLELSASDDHSQVSSSELKTLLQNAKILQSVTIGNGSSLWKDFVEFASSDVNLNKNISQLKLYNIAAPLDIMDFEFLKRLRLRSLSFQNCIVFQHVLQGILEISGNHLQSISVLGSQHEILSQSFINVMSLPHLSKLTLPIDGVSTEHGSNIVISMPSLTEFNVVGLFQTKFVLNKSQLLAINIYSSYPSYTGKTRSFRERREIIELPSEKQREFCKILAILLPQQPIKLQVDLNELNSVCLRRIYKCYPDLQELVVNNNSRNCLDGWTGIPIKTCRKISSCRSFAVANASEVQVLTSVSSLKSNWLIIS